ncbi:phosducin [Teratosphaeria destructans]|uniref:Phosducin n=1 Tax=Teratosphaeria destructans TaxID=418781 RepID=A0A9W7W5E2_9PEZI|nr:phosducin [Teratosphaeria destructans]
MTSAQDEFNELMRDKERRTAHPADHDDARSFLNLSDDEDDEDRTPPASQADPEDTAPRPSISSARATIPLTRYGANTGPKGVISDAQHFRDSQRLHRTSMRSTSSLASQLQNGMSLHERQRPLERLPSDSDDEDGLDDDFMRQWRSSRLRELQNGNGNRSQIHSRERSRRLWGMLATVNGEGYLDALDKSPTDTVVIVYIYDDYSDVSLELENCVRKLAQKHLETRFVKLHYADAEMEPAGVPALLAYRGGEKFAGLVPLLMEMPEDADVSALTLERVLQRRQIL